jgi:hypothetical protein
LTEHIMAIEDLIPMLVTEPDLVTKAELIYLLPDKAFRALVGLIVQSERDLHDGKLKTLTMIQLDRFLKDGTMGSKEWTDKEMVDLRTPGIIVLAYRRIRDGVSL